MSTQLVISFLLFYLAIEVPFGNEIYAWIGNVNNCNFHLRKVVFPECCGDCVQKVVEFQL